VQLELDLSVGIDKVPPERLDLLLQALYLVPLESLPAIVFFGPDFLFLEPGPERRAAVLPLPTIVIDVRMMLVPT
jgi:hypothetical protein